MVVCVCPSHPACSATPWLKCVHASVHVYLLMWLSMSASSPHWIVIWKPWWPCVAVWLCLNHPTSVHIPWLECLLVSVHVYMSTWLPVDAPPLLNSYIETRVYLCGTLCVLQSSHLWSHTLVRMCICISTYVYVHMTPNVSSNPCA